MIKDLEQERIGSTSQTILISLAHQCLHVQNFIYNKGYYLVRMCILHQSTVFLSIQSIDYWNVINLQF